MITPEILQEFKNRMHLGDDEDENLMIILKASYEDLTRICGAYDINISTVFKELVFERSRYVYNDALEYFHQNFLTQINNLSMANALDEIVLEDDSNEAV